LFCSTSNLCIAYSLTDSPFTSFATTRLQSISKSAPLKDPASSRLKCSLFSLSRHDQFQFLPTKKVQVYSWTAGTVLNNSVLHAKLYYSNIISKSSYEWNLYSNCHSVPILWNSTSLQFVCSALTQWLNTCSSFTKILFLLSQLLTSSMNTHIESIPGSLYLNARS
jgi:hypothetical protein